jgi:hypothetical protein
MPSGSASATEAPDRLPKRWLPSRAPPNRGRDLRMRAASASAGLVAAVGAGNALRSAVNAPSALTGSQAELSRLVRENGTLKGNKAHGRIGCVSAGNGRRAVRTRRWSKALKSAAPRSSQGSSALATASRPDVRSGVSRPDDRARPGSPLRQVSRTPLQSSVLRCLAVGRSPGARGVGGAVRRFRASLRRRGAPLWRNRASSIGSRFGTIEVGSIREIRFPSRGGRRLRRVPRAW